MNLFVHYFIGIDCKQYYYYWAFVVSLTCTVGTLLSYWEKHNTTSSLKKETNMRTFLTKI